MNAFVGPSSYTETIWRLFRIESPNELVFFFRIVTIGGIIPILEVEKLFALEIWIFVFTANVHGR